MGNTPSNIYWRVREEQQHKKNLQESVKHDKELEKIYRSMQVSIQKDIDAFYTRYATKEGISMAEAKKRADKLDIEAYAEKAKKYVATHDLSERANTEMRLYNMTMKVNRLELLKANIGMELVEKFEDMNDYMDDKLTERTAGELKRQAGILGGSVYKSEEMAASIVGASFHSATYSDRIWAHQDQLKYELHKLLSIGLIQGVNPKKLASEVSKLFGVSLRNAQRLMRTEMARVQTDAQFESYKRNGFEYYQYHTLGARACPICRPLDGKIFKVSEMLISENAPPMHPNCRCSTSASVGEKAYNDLLDAKADGTFGRGSGSSDIKEGETKHIGNVDFSDKPRVMKILDAAERKFAGADVEWDVTITSDGKIWVTKGSAGGVDLTGIRSGRKGAYSYHNHLDSETNYSFSEDDIAGFIANKEAYMKASDSSYSYEMRRQSDTVDMSWEEVYHRHKELSSREALEHVRRKDLDADEYLFDEVLRRMSKELGFDYVRKLK